MNTKERVGLSIYKFDGIFSHTKKRSVIYLLDSNYCGLTYIICDEDLSDLTFSELVIKLLKNVCSESTPEDYLMNCFRYGQKIDVMGNLISINDSFNIFRGV